MLGKVVGCRRVADRRHWVEMVPHELPALESEKGEYRWNVGRGMMVAANVSPDDNRWQPEAAPADGKPAGRLAEVLVPVWAIQCPPQKYSFAGEADALVRKRTYSPESLASAVVGTSEAVASRSNSSLVLDGRARIDWMDLPRRLLVCRGEQPEVGGPRALDSPSGGELSR